MFDSQLTARRNAWVCQLVYQFVNGSIMRGSNAIGRFREGMWMTLWIRCGLVDSPSFTQQLNGKYPDSNQLTHFKEIFQLNFAVGSELTNETGVRCGSFSVASYSMAIFHVDQSNRIGM